jgi:hypothetical protein
VQKSGGQVCTWTFCVSDDVTDRRLVAGSPRHVNDPKLRGERATYND